MTRFRRPAMALIGLCVGAVCLWLAARGVDWREASRIFRAVDASSLAAGIALFGANMLMRAGRWRDILTFRSPVRFAVTLRALLSGYAVNSALPARLGELFRADYLARRTGLSRSGVLASIFVERLLDLLAAVCFLAVGLVVVGGGDGATRGVLVGGVVVALIAGGILLLLASRLSRANGELTLSRLLMRLPLGEPLARLIGPRLGDFAELLRVVGTTHFGLAAIVTVLIWSAETGALWLVCRAVHIELGIGAALCLIGASSLSTLLPTAPGYFGSYQFAYVLVLAEFGVTATAAIVAATTAQVFLIGTYTLVGFLSLGAEAVLAVRRFGNE